jgi:hypothetical protein
MTGVIQDFELMKEMPSMTQTSPMRTFQQTEASRKARAGRDTR